MEQLLTVSAAPHIHTRRTVPRLMTNVIVALIPAVACALYYFGIGAAIVIATSVAGCMATEYVIARYMLGDKRNTLADGSALLTGILLGLNLPSNLPVWTILIGCVVAVGIGKMAFGGLGCNIFNPALVGRVFLLLSFPVAMTTWPLPVENRWNYFDAKTGATILGEIKTGSLDPATLDLWDKSLGMAGGSIGEVGAIALLLGLAYLLITRTVSWHIPLSILATVAVFTAILGDHVGVELLSGGLLLGSIFMATDYVTSPTSHGGMIVYGVMIGIITVIIRQWGAYPEGVSFAILIMNGVTPLINRFIKPRKFGERRRKA